ncbi:aminotransferase class III-fold pyridoxal phosphate-dependent enzyme [Roseovarius rhodophyticola]|uniref:Aminotransferase class III-fold pyridoxal phosphate-dependent enzyme n=1 Tax=Roseovarius rhodophyticola TaxID=3080827 RepID=A0ABZ2TKL1_9RHOB|nr:aminotransferase class III-fold pyridoxal phosphate-dependent enzyme [Roseovarius sp. W115]MDV2927879.1 aminotransferase class III-fold pyridoxal phosphate-dependent enzyme [Roseovarius sp. W115]
MKLNATTDDILSADNHLIQSFCDLDALKQNTARTVINRAEGAFVYDSDGNELIDGIAGLWCVNVGHGRQELIDAVTQQLGQLDYYSTFYNFTHPSAAHLAQKIADLAPASLNHVYFANSGSAANDSAIRILHHYNERRGKPDKKRVLSRHGAYHGSTYLAMAMTTPAFSQTWSSASDLVHHLRSPHHWREGGGMTEAEFLDALMEDLEQSIAHLGADNIAAFIAEPIMGAGGVIVAPKGYHVRSAEICRANDIKYISDEVVTAFGRLGHFFASQEMFGVEPDIITSAKGLTSGYQPLSATIISDEIYEVISAPGEKFLHGFTYSGHPAASAVALANIEVMEREKLPEQVRTTGKQFESTLRDLGELDIVGEVRGSHFMMGIELVKDKATKVSFDDDVEIGGKVAEAAQKRGLIARPLGNSLILSPTLVMQPDLIEKTGDILRESITAVAKTVGH